MGVIHRRLLRRQRQSASDTIFSASLMTSHRRHRQISKQLPPHSAKHRRRFEKDASDNGAIWQISTWDVVGLEGECPTNRRHHRCRCGFFRAGICSQRHHRANRQSPAPLFDDQGPAPSRDPEFLAVGSIDLIREEMLQATDVNSAGTPAGIGLEFRTLFRVLMQVRRHSSPSKRCIDRGTASMPARDRHRFHHPAFRGPFGLHFGTLLSSGTTRRRTPNMSLALNAVCYRGTKQTSKHGVQHRVLFLQQPAAPVTMTGRRSLPSAVRSGILHRVPRACSIFAYFP